MEEFGKDISEIIPRLHTSGATVQDSPEIDEEYQLWLINKGAIKPHDAPAAKRLRKMKAKQNIAQHKPTSKRQERRAQLVGKIEERLCEPSS